MNGVLILTATLHLLSATPHRLMDWTTDTSPTNRAQVAADDANGKTASITQSRRLHLLEAQAKRNTRLAAIAERSGRMMAGGIPSENNAPDPVTSLIKKHVPPLLEPGLIALKARSVNESAGPDANAAPNSSTP